MCSVEVCDKNRRCSRCRFPTLSSSLLWKLLSRWWKWISVICRSRERRQETYSPCIKERVRQTKTEAKQLQTEGDFCGRKPNRYLSSALGTALSSGRLHWMRFAHDGQQSLQKYIQQTLHHHLHLLLNRRLLNGENRLKGEWECFTLCTEKLYMLW